MSKESPEYRRHWPAFVAEMEHRLEKGHAEYGDASFNRDPEELLAEIEEELLDVILWRFIHRAAARKKKLTGGQNW